MLTVKDIMTTDLITVSPQTDIIKAAKLLLENHINGVPVIDEAGKLVGILCQSDLVAQQQKLPIPSYFSFLDGLIAVSSMKKIKKQVEKIAAATVADAMTANPTTVQPYMAIEVVAALMVEKHFHTVPVADEGRLVGIVGKEDILRTLLSGSEAKRPDL